MTYQLTITSRTTGKVTTQTYDNQADAQLAAELNEGYNDVVIEEVQ